MEKEKKKISQKMFSKKGVSLISEIAVICLVFVLYILGDYLAFRGTLDFATSPIYWITTTISLVLLIALMITVRNLRKDKQISESEDIANNMKTVSAARKVVLINAYDEILQKHIDKVNEDYKYETYINKITKKINRINIHCFFTFRWSAKKRDKLLIKYEEQLRLSKEEVLKKNIKFKKITQTGLFAGVDGKLAVYNKYDISTHEGKDIFNMTSSKAIMVYLLTAISGTMIVSFMFGGWAAIWGTLLKIFSLLFATSSAIRQADNFVAYNIEQALDNRLRIILQFVNSREDIKQKVLEKLQEKKEEIKSEK